MILTLFGLLTAGACCLAVVKLPLDSFWKFWLFCSVFTQLSYPPALAVCPLSSLASSVLGYSTRASRFSTRFRRACFFNSRFTKDPDPGVMSLFFKRLRQRNVERMSKFGVTTSLGSSRGR